MGVSKAINIILSDHQTGSSNFSSQVTNISFNMAEMNLPCSPDPIAVLGETVNNVEDCMCETKTLVNEKLPKARDADIPTPAELVHVSPYV